MKPIFFIALLAVLISCLYAFYLDDRPRVDAAAYDKIAWNLTRGYGYVEDESYAANPEDDWGINRLGPLYEFFLAGIYAIFGHSIKAVWIIQALLRGVSVVLIYKLAKEFFGISSNVPIIAALLFAFAPELIILTGLLLTETLFLTLFLASLFLTAILFKRKSFLIAGGTGTLWALSILTRPTALLPLLLLLVYYVLKKEWRIFTGLLLIPVFLLGSWSLFASLRYDRFILTTGVVAYDVWVGNNPQARGGFEKAPEVQQVRNSGISSKELDRISKEKYIEFLKNNPFRFLELQVRKAAIYFSLARPGGFWIVLWDYPRELAAVISFSLIWLVVIFVGGLAGSIYFWHSRPDAQSRMFVLFALLQPLAVIPIIVESRYRIPLFPFLIIFAAYFYTKRPLRKNAIVSSLAFLGLTTSYDIFSNASYFLNQLRRFL